MKGSVKIALSEVNKLAWAIMKEVANWREAMCKAWATLKLKASMLIGPTSFKFIKDDGTVREAVADNSRMPERKADAKPKPFNPLVIVYFDTIANGVRSFRADRLLLA